MAVNVINETIVRGSALILNIIKTDLYLARFHELMTRYVYFHK